ncbi:MAG: beta-propeller fold lactonase family protein [Acidobacteria bacterium]|nr:beta-propeller fold lactonase family protein [Acidobacteriota bacterium]
MPSSPERGRKDSYVNPRGAASKVYVSCWNDASVAVVDFANNVRRVSYIPVGRHPTAMKLDETGARLYVVNSDDDSVSVIDTGTDREIERINVRLAEHALMGGSPEGLALGEDGRTLYVANAHSNSVAVVRLAGDGARGTRERPARRGDGSRAGDESRSEKESRRSVVRGFIPAGLYPSAIAVAGGRVFVGNGKGTGFENSSVVVSNRGSTPNVPNDRFPAGTGRGGGQGGQYSVSLVSGNISLLAEPVERELAAYTQAVMRHNNLLGEARAKLFRGRTPIKHVIYVIRENRTYDQVFGDVERADGDARLAIFGAGEAARLQSGAAQSITPNAHALAARFGLLDRFFVNAEASPDGHNWSTAAFSNDYVDKAYRWNYSGRGRTFDFEGFNRLPSYGANQEAGPLFRDKVGAAEIAAYMRRYVPYLHGGRDVAEPGTLYLWDAAARAGLTYRNYGEFVGTFSESDVAAINANRAKSYPDTSPTASAFPTKKSLEGHHSPTYRNFDTNTPDSMTTASYRAARESAAPVDPLVSRRNADERLRGYSRMGDWLEEFQSYASDVAKGLPDRLPNFSIVRLPNDHTVGLRAGQPTPQFFVAENDYAVGRLVEAVSQSPYWKDTAILIVEDDAQDGPDHVDCHRSIALVISAYNRPGALVHEFHSTVSLIRTMELLLGISPMNQLDASAAPIDIFQDKADLRPFKALLPDVSLDNLITPPPRDPATAYWMRRTAEQDLAHADMADPLALNQIIWFSVRGASAPMPSVSRLPAFDALREGVAGERETEAAGR